MLYLVVPNIHKMTRIKNAIFVMIIVFSCCHHGFGYEEQAIIFRNSDNSNDLAESLTDNGCNTTNGDTGECISILKCPALLALIGKPNQREFLQQSRCGWDGDCPLVCCGPEPSVNTKRICTAAELHWCKSDEFDECCIPELTYNIHGTTATSSIQPIKDSRCDSSSLPPEPSSGCCGQELSSLRTIPGEITLIYQYPWTAIIEYAGTDTIQVKCGGTLISGRYVLTAAHCLFVDKLTPVNIRLGDFDIDHPGIDCFKGNNFGEDCTNGAVTIPIEESTSHPEYDSNSRSQTNDIALIKLQDDAPYTDYIRPICLPSIMSDFTETADSRTRLHVAGWGLMRNELIHSPLKRQMMLPFVRAENCFMLYRLLNIILDDGQICAGGEEGKNPCKGDSGGALMLVENQRTEIVGIASFSSCGRTNRPAVYIKVLHYLPWIRTIIN